MIIPSFLKSTVGAIVTLVLVVAFGAGAVYGWKWYNERQAKKDVLAQPAIAENRAALDAQGVVVTREAGVYRGSSTDFRSSARRVLADPRTTPEAKTTITKGVKAINDCDTLTKAMQKQDSLHRAREELLLEDAVRARRGRLLVISTAVGYSPYASAPAVRAGIDLNISKNWNITGTTDLAVKYRMNSGKPTTQVLRTDFIGVNYRWGGR